MTGTITDDLKLSFDMVISNPLDPAREKVGRFIIGTGNPFCMSILQEDVDDLGLLTKTVRHQVIAGIEASVDDVTLSAAALVLTIRSVGVQFLLGRVLRIGYPSHQIGFEFGAHPKSSPGPPIS